jgi:hypothetical protein
MAMTAPWAWFQTGITAGVGPLAEAVKVLACAHQSLIWARQGT